MRNKIYHIALFLSICCLTTESVILTAATQTDTIINPDLQASAEAAEGWFKLIDRENYDQSWDKSSATLQLLVPKKDWRKLMEGIRKPLGTMKSRQIIEQRPAKDPAGLPKGDYMVLVYKSSFSSKPSANELVTMVKESDGRWKSLTYQVK
ncbi:MAG TPA: DUF4019 domain-containing protein [Waddliaceae bacterium]